MSGPAFPSARPSDASPRIGDLVGATMHQSDILRSTGSWADDLKPCHDPLLSTEHQHQQNRVSVEAGRCSLASPTGLAPLLRYLTEKDAFSEWLVDAGRPPAAPHSTAHRDEPETSTKASSPSWVDISSPHVQDHSPGASSSIVVVVRPNDDGHERGDDAPGTLRQESPMTAEDDSWSGVSWDSVEGQSRLEYESRRRGKQAESAQRLFGYRRAGELPRSGQPRLQRPTRSRRGRGSPDHDK